MRKQLFLVVALSLSAAALTSFAQHAPSDSTARGTQPIPPTNPTNPYPTNPTPPVDQPGGAMQSQRFDSFKNLKDGEVLGVIAAIDSIEINAARVVLNTKHGKSGTSSGGNSSTMGSTMGKSATRNGDDVEAFAAMLKRDHEKNLKDAKMLAKKINVTLSSASEPVRMVRQNGKTGLAQLKTMSGTALEREYVKAMVEGHQKALQIIDTMMPPVNVQSSTPGTTQGSYGTDNSSTPPTIPGSNAPADTKPVTKPVMTSNSAEVRGFLTQTRIAVAEHLVKAQELQSQISVGQR
jgi:hypothetical protein